MVMPLLCSKATLNLMPQNLSKYVSIIVRRKMIRVHQRHFHETRQGKLGRAAGYQKQRDVADFDYSAISSALIKDEVLETSHILQKRMKGIGTLPSSAWMAATRPCLGGGRRGEVQMSMALSRPPPTKT